MEKKKDREEENERELYNGSFTTGSSLGLSYVASWQCRRGSGGGGGGG